MNPGKFSYYGEKTVVCLVPRICDEIELAGMWPLKANYKHMKHSH